MSNIDTLQLKSLLSPGLQSYGVTDDVFETEAVSNILTQLSDEFNKYLGNLVSEAGEAIKVGSTLANALKDKSSPQEVPEPQSQQPVEPAPGPAPMDMGAQPPMPDVGMTPPPAPMDMGTQPPMPDAGAQLQASPDMMQFDPNMIGAVQPRF